ncbi:MAG: enoyl-CoA hydratase/isomerase family protein [Planctomycetes bacterium]|nr:enoyl-CoA hydratase/isomerase family protein [Planctomycetota bacterium]
MIKVIEFGPAPANIVDRANVAYLRQQLAAAADDKSIKLVVIKGEGDHFSYGASVQEHTPDLVGNMLREFHDFMRFVDELDLPPLMAAVKGRCFGGGFEVALLCDIIAVADDALLGCPEISLGVFPPAGSALLPLRTTAGRASEMLSSGRFVDAQTAVAYGIAEYKFSADNFMSDIEEWAEKSFAKLSASSLRHTRKASRWPYSHALNTVLPDLEKQYLESLMKTADANEGINAFIEKRKPEGQNR